LPVEGAIGIKVVLHRPQAKAKIERLESAAMGLIEVIS
jgi:hypothetical protein